VAFPIYGIVLENDLATREKRLLKRPASFNTMASALEDMPVPQASCDPWIVVFPQQIVELHR
jgi:hypothetical protein